MNSNTIAISPSPHSWATTSTIKLPIHYAMDVTALATSKNPQLTSTIFKSGRIIIGLFLLQINASVMSKIYFNSAIKPSLVYILPHLILKVPYLPCFLSPRKCIQSQIKAIISKVSTQTYYKSFNAFKL